MKQIIPRYSRRSIMAYEPTQNPEQTIRTDVRDDSQGTNFAEVTSFGNIPDSYNLPDNSLQMRLFQQNHPHLRKTLDRAMFQNPNTKYAMMQRGEC